MCNYSEWFLKTTIFDMKGFLFLFAPYDINIFLFTFLLTSRIPLRSLIFQAGDRWNIETTKVVLCVVINNNYNNINTDGIHKKILSYLSHTKRTYNAGSSIVSFSYSVFYHMACDFSETRKYLLVFSSYF